MDDMKIFVKIATLAVVFSAATALTTGCRKDEPVQRSTSQQVTNPDPDPGEIKGFFVLNEANMGSNKASIDYYDYGTGV